MFEDRRFDVAVFYPWHGRNIAVHELFSQLQPRAKTVPIVSTGGATLDLIKLIGSKSIATDVRFDFDYISVFHRHMDISVKDAHYNRWKTARP